MRWWWPTYEENIVLSVFSLDSSCDQVLFDICWDPFTHYDCIPHMHFRFSLEKIALTSWILVFPQCPHQRLFWKQNKKMHLQTKRQLMSFLRNTWLLTHSIFYTILFAFVMFFLKIFWFFSFSFLHCFRYRSICRLIEPIAMRQNWKLPGRIQPTQGITTSMWRTARVLISTLSFFKSEVS